MVSFMGVGVGRQHHHKGPYKREAGVRIRGDVTMETAEAGARMPFEDGGRGHEPRNAGKTRNGLSSRASSRCCQHLDFPAASFQNCRGINLCDFKLSSWLSVTAAVRNECTGCH